MTTSATVFNGESLHDVHTRMRKVVSIIKVYQWIIDAYVSDFYTKHHWNKLPQSLRVYFDSTEPPDLAWLLCHDPQNQTCCRPVSTNPPLSLLALRQCISLLALSRTSVDTISETTKLSILSACIAKRHAQDVCAQEKRFSMKAGASPNYKNGQCMDMKHIFRKNVKPKKQHEINNLGQIVSILAEAVGCQSVVDVGAGLGHLARILVFQHRLVVTTVEATDGHGPKASELDKDLKKNINKARKKKQTQQTDSDMEYCVLTASKPSKDHVNQDINNYINTTEADPLSAQTNSKSDRQHEEMMRTHIVNFGSERKAEVTGSQSEIFNSSGREKDALRDEFDEIEMPNHVICTVQPDIAASQFLEILKRSDRDSSTPNKEEDLAIENPSFILASLHACGDLTPTLLRVFLECPTAQGLASVACCYMKMSATKSDDPSSLENFPMSSFLQDLSVPCLSYEAREMACHFVDAYHARLLDNPPHLKIHAYRAALQKLVTTIDPKFVSGQARLVSKKGADGTFMDYAKENLRKLKKDIETVPDSLLLKCEELTQHWTRVVAFYTLRLSLAPLVETLLLYDRALYLLENGVPSILLPIFDPQISPRNFVLLAVKQ